MSQTRVIQQAIDYQQLRIAFLQLRGSTGGKHAMGDAE